MSDINQLSRFLFDEQAVRGELVQIDSAYKEIIANHNYPRPVQQLVGDLMAATSLLTATLKFEGQIAVQVQGEGPIRMAAINADHEQVMRGVVRMQSDIKGESFKELIGDKAHLVITITPKVGERYQGVVALDKPSLAECLEAYFQQSEQLVTRLWLYTDVDSKQTGGALLQIMPESAAPSSVTNDFSHLATLMDTLTAKELFNVDAETLLYRLFHQEKVRMFPPQTVSYKCGCSRKRCEDALVTVDAEVLNQELTDKGSVDMTCEYCLTTYSFNAGDVKDLLGQAATKH